jgi:long-chain acyl-CoA synthetase
MTECAPLIGYSNWRKFKIYSCGAVARPSVEVRIDSDNPADVPGEIQVKGDAVMVGYYKNEKATDAVFTQDGWLKTGDMGTMDSEENMYIRGRCKNMILTANGQNIYPEEIEDLLNQLPMVAESLIVGRKNTLVALVVPNLDAAQQSGLNEEELKKIIKGWYKRTHTDGLKLGAKMISAAIFQTIKKHLKKKAKPSLRDYQRAIDEIAQIIAIQFTEQDDSEENEVVEENENDGTTESNDNANS